MLHYAHYMCSKDNVVIIIHLHLRSKLRCLDKASSVNLFILFFFCFPHHFSNYYPLQLYIIKLNMPSKQSFHASASVIHRTGPASVIYNLSQPCQTTITLPAKSIWTSGLHWHETHDEYLKVVKGSIHVRLGPSSSIVREGEEVKVEKFVRHEWSRAKPDDNDEAVVIERTEPADIEKHLFFWNLNGIILESITVTREDWVSRWFIDWTVTLKLFMVFCTLDNWPVFYDLEAYRNRNNGLRCFLTLHIESMVTHLVLLIAWIVGTMLGWNAVDEAFTPSTLMKEWKGRRSTNAKKEI
jgi:uncharacterized RmlC-like cupin family protein